MDVAIDRKTGEIVSSDELLLLESVDSQGYSCIGCSVKATPCSYTKSNKKRPYFRFDENTIHDADCFMIENKQQHIQSNGSFVEGYPNSYPNKLEIKKEVTKNTSSISGKSINSEGSNSAEKKHISSFHNYSVNTLFPIIRTYLHTQNDNRVKMKLNIPDVIGENYSEIIWSLPSEIKPLANKIRYSKIYLPKPYAIIGKYLEIKLLQGNWENNKPVKLYKLLIEIQNWPVNKIEYITRQIDTAINEHKEESAKNVYVFFIGKQYERLDVITIDRYNFFCCIAHEKFS
jgi:hypothetical protein